MTAEHKVVSHDEWIEARKAFLVREKEFARRREALARDLRDLPWEAVTKEYVFDGPAGKRTLRDLFEGRGQLVVYHFMFPPEWDAGCPHCSFWADSFDSSPRPPPGPRRVLRCGLPGAAGEDLGLQGADGLVLPLVFRGRDALQLRLRRLVPGGCGSGRDRCLQLRVRARAGGPRRDQRVRPGRPGPGVPHLLDVRAASTRSTAPTSCWISPPAAATNQPRAIPGSGSAVTTSTAADPDSPDQNGPNRRHY